VLPRGRWERKERTDVLIPAAHDPLDHLVLRQSVRSTHQRERGESPVDAVHAEVFGEVVREVIAVLRGAEQVRRAEGGQREGSGEDEPGRATGCI
jgi:hypothetical protein